MIRALALAFMLTALASGVDAQPADLTRSEPAGGAPFDRLRDAGLLALGLGLLSWGVLREAGRTD